MLITHRAAMTYRTWYRREWDRQNIGQTEHRTDRTSDRQDIRQTGHLTDRTSDRQDIRQTGHQTNSKRISSREHNGENTVTKTEETKPCLLTYLHNVTAP